MRQKEGVENARVEKREPVETDELRAYEHYNRSVALFAQGDFRGRPQRRRKRSA
jgi:hypothetical protein